GEKGACEVTDGRRFTDEPEGHVCLDRLLRVDLEEIDVNRVAGAALALDSAKDHVARRLLAIDVELDHRAQTCGADGAPELARIELHSLRVDASAIDVGRETALA